MNDLQSVALGTGTADLAIVNGRVVLPEAGVVRERDLVVVDDRVAALPADASPVIDGGTTVIDADGCHVAPGFVDAHSHLDVFQTYEGAYHYSLAGGTTSVVSETISYASGLGHAGVRLLLEATADLPVSVFPTVPPVWHTDTFEPMRADTDAATAFENLLAHDRIAGTGEIAWVHVVGRDSPTESLFERARGEGKPIAGHGAGVSGEKLAAFATVVDDDHEAISAEGFRERVEHGLHAIGRGGSIRDDLGALAEASEDLGVAELSLSTDGMWPPDLLEAGHMDEMIRAVIDDGVPPVDAIRMATVNPARHFGLDRRGSLAPGSFADVVVLSDLESVAVRDVVADGEVVVRDGEPLVGPRSHVYPDAVTNSVAIVPDESDFHVSADAVPGEDVRAIGFERGLVTSETTVAPPVVDGRFGANPDEDVALVGLFDRSPHGPGDVPENGFVGFVTGFGFERGAAATTVTWEYPGFVVVGTSPAEMASAASRVAEMGGGWAVVEERSVIADLALPVAAVAARTPITETAAGMERVVDALESVGVTSDRPMLGVQTLTFPGVPALKLSSSGYVDILNRDIVGLSPTGE